MNRSQYPQLFNRGLWGILASLASLSHAQPTPPTCQPVTSAQFTVTEVFNLSGNNGASASDASITEPTQMDLLGVYSGGKLDHVDIYFVERKGKVKWYDGATKTIKQIGTIQVHGVDDNGLMGITLDPKFSENRLLYLWYTPKVANNNMNRHLKLSRFKVTTGNTLDMASELNMIDILASKTDQWHTGGPMVWDSYGDLWIAVGNNTRDLDPGTFSQYSKTDSSNSAEWGPSNTANMRGGILRIHPDAAALTGKGYTIPAGNFGEYFASEFEKSGDSRATEYRNTAKVLPELYVKGTRSNYSIAVHPTKRWVAWGEVNYASTNDEFNITAKPAFTGFPYFHGNNARIFGQQETMGFLQDVAKPRNVSPMNSGVEYLPAAKAADATNLVNVAMGGPIYASNPNLVSTTKFPDHFNNTWFNFGFNGGIWLQTLDTVKVGIAKTEKIDGGIFSKVKPRNHVMSKFGPEGSLYILNYDGYYNDARNPGVMRVDYTGPACNVVTAVQPVASRTVSDLIVLQGDGLRVGVEGRHTFELTDLQGKVVYSQAGEVGARYALSAISKENRLPKALYLAKVSYHGGVYSKPVALF